MEMSGFEVYIKNRPKLVKGPKLFLIMMFETSGFLFFLSLLFLFLLCYKTKTFKPILNIHIIHKCVYPCIVLREYIRTTFEIIAMTSSKFSEVISI